MDLIKSKIIIYNNVIYKIWVMLKCKLKLMRNKPRIIKILNLSQHLKCN